VISLFIVMFIFLCDVFLYTCVYVSEGVFVFVCASLCGLCVGLCFVCLGVCLVILWHIFCFFFVYVRVGLACV